jgi:hypothetical protein
MTELYLYLVKYWSIIYNWPLKHLVYTGVKLSKVYWKGIRILVLLSLFTSMACFILPVLIHKGWLADS